MVAGSMGYFGSEPVMSGASIAQIVEAGAARALPPLWICYPSEDTNVPRPIVEHLRDAWAAAGGLVEMTVYEGERHGFGHAARSGHRRLHRRAELVLLLRHLGSAPAV